jgi:hypothetical protein
MKTRKKIWTEDEVKFLTENYYKKGIDFCVENLNVKKTSVTGKAKTLGITHRHVIKRTKEELDLIIENYKKETAIKIDIAIKEALLNMEKKCNKETLERYRKNLNIKQFYNIKSAEIAWILGFIWADGFINGNGIYIQTKSDDMDSMENIFLKIGKWNRKNRYRKNSKHEQTTLWICNKFLIKFLIENDFHLKSYVSPEKILKLIPDELKHYFYLGWADGDGSFYYNIHTVTYAHKFGITSRLDYDWSAFEGLLKTFDIKYSKFLKCYKGGKSSDIQITDRKSVIALGEYLYQNFDKDHIGLQRKYDKYIQIINSYNKNF